MFVKGSIAGHHSQPPAQPFLSLVTGSTLSAFQRPRYKLRFLHHRLETTPLAQFSSKMVETLFPFNGFLNPPPLASPNSLNLGTFRTDKRGLIDGLYRRVYHRLNKDGVWVEYDGHDREDIKDNNCAFTVYSRFNPQSSPPELDAASQGLCPEFDTAISIDSDCLRKSLRSCLPSLHPIYSNRPLVTLFMSQSVLLI